MRVEYDQALSLLRISGSLTMETVEEAHVLLLAQIAKHGDDAIDLSQVDECSTAGVQLVLAIGKSRLKAGKSLRIHGASRAMQKAAADIGVELDTILALSKETTGPSVRECAPDVAHEEPAHAQ